MKIINSRSKTYLSHFARLYVYLSISLFVLGMIGGATLALNGIQPALLLGR
jgi:hypothetical protein